MGRGQTGKVGQVLGEVALVIMSILTGVASISTGGSTHPLDESLLSLAACLVVCGQALGAADIPT